MKCVALPVYSICWCQCLKHVRVDKRLDFKCSPCLEKIEKLELKKFKEMKYSISVFVQPFGARGNF